jgi:hypothetical protein
MGAILFFIASVAFIGGIRKSPKPFFWLKDNRPALLKTPTQYIIFGVGFMTFAAVTIIKVLKEAHLF